MSVGGAVVVAREASWEEERSSSSPSIGATVIGGHASKLRFARASSIARTVEALRLRVPTAWSRESRLTRRPTLSSRRRASSELSPITGTSPSVGVAVTRREPRGARIAPRPSRRAVRTHLRSLLADVADESGTGWTCRPAPPRREEGHPVRIRAGRATATRSEASDGGSGTFVKIEQDSAVKSTASRLGF